MPPYFIRSYSCALQHDCDFPVLYILLLALLWVALDVRVMVRRLAEGGGEGI